MHREIHKSRHIIVLILTVIIFSLGVLIGSQVEDFRIDNLENQFREESNKFTQIQAEIDYINFLIESEDNISCGTLTDSYLTSVEQLDDSVFRLENYQSTATFNQKQYRELQNQYFNLETRYFILAQSINTICPFSFDTILYFYTDDENCPECEDQGVYLDHIKNKYQDDVMIFSFDTQGSSNIVTLLRLNYDIDVFETPTIIINGEEQLGFSSSQTIEEYLFENE
ncbi:MAG: hypothetical protein ACLFPL_02975 [Candidatus Nanoarchaeia archaeon]